jgi:hypothetical protein
MSECNDINRDKYKTVRYAMQSINQNEEMFRGDGMVEKCAQPIHIMRKVQAQQESEVVRRVEAIGRCANIPARVEVAEVYVRGVRRVHRRNGHVII